MKLEEFRILVSSDLDYEKMVIMLEFDNMCFAILSAENGIEKAEIEIKSKFSNRTIWRFDYAEFMNCLEDGFTKMKELN